MYKNNQFYTVFLGNPFRWLLLVKCQTAILGTKSRGTRWQLALIFKSPTEYKTKRKIDVLIYNHPVPIKF